VRCGGFLFLRKCRLFTPSTPPSSDGTPQFISLPTVGKP